MRYVVIDDIVKLEQFKDKWGALKENANFTPFLSYEWIHEWLKFFGGKDLFIIAGMDNDDMSLIMPLYRRGLRYRFIGYTNSDYLDVISASGDWGRLNNFMRNNLPTNYVIDLEHIPEDSRFLKYVTSGNISFNSVVLPQEICPFIKLPSTWDEFLKTLDKRFRKNLEYAIRRLYREFNVELLDPVSDEDVDVFLNKMIELHQRRWRRKKMPGVFYSKKIRDFHRAVSREMQKGNSLLLKAIKLNGEMAAVLYGFKTDTCYYYYLSGFDDRFSKYSIGNVIVGLTVKEAIEKGKRTFDFLRGGESYKYLWTDKDRRIYRLILYDRGIFQNMMVKGIIVGNNIEMKVKGHFSE